jgi:hypothetical protein
MQRNWDRNWKSSYRRCLVETSRKRLLKERGKLSLSLYLLLFSSLSIFLCLTSYQAMSLPIFLSSLLFSSLHLFSFFFLPIYLFFYLFFSLSFHLSLPISLSSFSYLSSYFFIFLFLSLRIGLQITTRFHSLLATENKSSYYHSSDMLILSSCTECPKVYNHVL